ncbi:hypothetical protein Q4582_00475 [Poseidonibacter sp. 1_MG-2023]|nr:MULTISPECIES: hypothetical protein [Poseidonibacter]MDO6826512.1 hypothetical protein [Poseidonibacter sp. 1_MG-2023]
MKNILIIILVVAGLGYMGSILLDRYQTIKTTNETIKSTQQPSK